jgi:hypothetical protein
MSHTSHLWLIAEIKASNWENTKCPCSFAAAISSVALSEISVRCGHLKDVEFAPTYFSTCGDGMIATREIQYDGNLVLFSRQ